MRKLLLTCIATAASFTAFAQTDVTPVVNKYKGDLYISLEEDEIYDEESKVTANVYVKATTEAGKVDFSLPNFSFAGLPLGDIFLPNIDLAQNDSTYTFGENKKVRFTFLPGTEDQIVADAYLDNTRSYVKGDSIIAYIPVTWIIAESETPEENVTAPIHVMFKGVVANTFTLDNTNFDGDNSWGYSKPWDSKNGYKNLFLLSGEDKFWSATKYTIDDFITPNDWCIGNVTGINGLGATVVGKKHILNAEAETPDYAVTLTNTANPMMKTQIVPGYMTLGTSWATANVADLKNSADGGAFGGVAFKGKPDAIQFDYMRTHGEANPTENATVVAYLWKGEYKQADVPGETGGSSKVTMYGRDRNILGIDTNQGGKVSKSEDAACVASVVKSIEGDQTDALTTMVVDLNYGEFAGTDVQPDSLNIIFAANDYFGDRNKMGVDNSLTVDNIKFIYRHGIKNAMINGKEIAFADDNTATTTEVYDENKFSFTKVGEGATVTKNYNGETGVLTIRVDAQDVKFNPEATTTYTIQFALVPEAINQVKADATSTAKTIYTIDGRRTNTLVKGVNIINNKKIIK